MGCFPGPSLSICGKPLSCDQSKRVTFSPFSLTLRGNGYEHARPVEEEGGIEPAGQRLPSASHISARKWPRITEGRRDAPDQIAGLRRSPRRRCGEQFIFGRTRKSGLHLAADTRDSRLYRLGGGLRESRQRTGRSIRKLDLVCGTWLLLEVRHSGRDCRGSRGIL
jgi:hypothetical protein